MPRVNMHMGFINVTRGELDVLDIGKKLGEGGYGIVYSRPHHPDTVLKLTTDAQELIMAKRLKANPHAAFVRVYDFFPVGEPYGWEQESVTAIILERVLPVEITRDERYALSMLAREYMGRFPADMHSENTGRRADGTPVILDIGQ